MKIGARKGRWRSEAGKVTAAWQKVTTAYCCHSAVVDYNVTCGLCLENRTSASATAVLNPRLHDTTCCQTGCQTCLTTGCIVYTNIQPVVKLVWRPVWQTAVSCIQSVVKPVGCLFTRYSRLWNRLYNRLYGVNGALGLLVYYLYLYINLPVHTLTFTFSVCRMST